MGELLLEAQTARQLPQQGTALPPGVIPQLCQVSPHLRGSQFPGQDALPVNVQQISACSAAPLQHQQVQPPAVQRPAPLPELPGKPPRLLRGKAEQPGGFHPGQRGRTVLDHRFFQCQGTASSFQLV